MRRIAFALGLAALLAGGVEARTIYVSPTSTATDTAMSVTPTTMALFNSRARPGDTAILSAGAYSTGINPSNSGTSIGNRITYVGNLAAPDFTSIPYLSTAAGANFTRDYVSIKGVKLLAENNIVADYDSIALCNIGSPSARATRYFLGKDADSGADHTGIVVSDCKFYLTEGITVGGNQYKCSTGWDSIGVASRDTIKNCFIDIFKSGRSQKAAMLMGNSDRVFISRCTIKIMYPYSTTAGGTGNGGIFKLYHAYRLVVEDTKFDIYFLPTVWDYEAGWSYIRDGSRYCRFERDTFDFHTAGPAYGSNYQVQFMGSGSGACTPETPSYVAGSCSGSGASTCTGPTDGANVVQNKYLRCLFRDSTGVGGSSGGMFGYQNGSRSDTLLNNVFITRRATLAWSVYGGGIRGGIVCNNTFINTYNSTSARAAGLIDGWAGIVPFYNNVFYAPYGSSTVNTDSWGLGGDYYGDFNLYYSTNSATAWSNANGGSSPPLANGTYSIGSGSSPCTSGNPAWDCNSQFANPMIASSTQQNVFSYDFRVSRSSPTLTTSSFNGNVVGAYNGTTPTSFYWVAPDSGVAHVGHADSTGIDSTHAITLYQANRMAKPGDTFILMPGRYDLNRPHRYAIAGAGGAAINLYSDDAQSVAPGRDGQHNTEGLADSSQAIRYVSLWYYKQAMRGFASAAIDTGAMVANGMPRVAGITIANKAIHVAGISADSIRVLTYLLPGSTGYVAYAEWDSLTYCKARTVNVISARNVTMRNCWVISPYVATASGAANARNSLSGAIEFKFLSGLWHTYLDQNQLGISIANQSNGVHFTRSRLEGILTPSAQTPDTCAFIRMSRSVNLYVDTCTVKVNCFTAGETNPAGSVDSLTARAFDLRDDAQYVHLISDTLNLGTRSGNLATVLIGTAGGPINNVVIQDCIISGDWALVPRIRSSAWSLLRSALGSKRGTPVYWGATAGTSTSASKSDSITISQCSFYADSLANGKSQPVLALLLDQSADLVQVNRNIFYRLKTTAASSTGDTCGAIVRYGNVAYSTGFSTDANLYFTPSDSSQNAVYCEGWTRTGYGPNCAARIDYGTNPAPPCIKDNIKTQTSAVLSTEGALALNTDEENSYWGTPSFIDARVDSAFDGRIYCSSVTSAYVPNWVGSFGDSAVGANQPQFTVTPSVCTELDTILATSGALTVVFTSGANDGATNRGSPAGYYVHYGTNPTLSEGTYLTATVAPGEPGATITTTLTSLSANTTYYFAVITVGRCGDQSPLSAIQCGVTRKSTGQSGGDICREN